MMSRTALMAAVTAVAAQITIPLPFSPVPFTMQVLAVILSGLLLGPRYGALAQAIYVLIGAVGVPAQGVVPFVPLDLVKVALSALVATAAAPAIAPARA
jgi:biotin transporter BioY